jgi:hypothetical protein
MDACRCIDDKRKNEGEGMIMIVIGSAVVEQQLLATGSM